MSVQPNTLKKLVDLFLAWQLPASVCSDEICTKHSIYTGRIRYGTNLLTASEAAQMFEHVLASFSDPFPSSHVTADGHAIPVAEVMESKPFDDTGRTVKAAFLMDTSLEAGTKLYAAGPVSMWAYERRGEALKEARAELNSIRRHALDFQEKIIDSKAVAQTVMLPGAPGFTMVVFPANVVPPDTAVFVRPVVSKRTFDQAWALKVSVGYQYGENALEQVRLGWNMAHELDIQS